MRLFGKIILSIIAFVSILLALSTYAVNQKIGSAEKTQATVQKALQKDAISLAVGTALVDQFLKDGDKEKEVSKAKKIALDRAAGKAVQAAAVPISKEVGRAYTAFLSNSTTVIKLHDTIVAVAGALKQVDSSIKIDAQSDTGNFTIKADKAADHVAKLKLVNSIKQLINSWWIFLLIALGLFVGISFIDKRKSVGAWRWPGFITFISGGLLLLANSIWPKLASEGVPTDQQDAFHSLSSAIDSTLTVVAVLATVIGAGLIIFSFIFKGKD